ncbi:hypothetical protein MICRO11B_100077 [Micrococcus luteus]|nr:hypothetical protein MICRO11B_100077 [Micrococcus luteus]
MRAEGAGTVRWEIAIVLGLSLGTPLPPGAFEREVGPFSRSKVPIPPMSRSKVREGGGRVSVVVWSPRLPPASSSWSTAPCSTSAPASTPPSPAGSAQPTGPRRPWRRAGSSTACWCSRTSASSG